MLPADPTALTYTTKEQTEVLVNNECSFKIDRQRHGFLHNVIRTLYLVIQVSHSHIF